MVYSGSYKTLIFQMRNKLEDAATVPGLHQGYPMVALVREWREVKADLDGLAEDGVLTEAEADQAMDFLFKTVDEYLTDWDEDEDGTEEQ